MGIDHQVHNQVFNKYYPNCVISYKSDRNTAIKQ